METWKLLLITLLSAVLVGCSIGVLVGKHQLKKKRSDYKPLLTNKERIIYSASILVGAACIAFGLLYTPPVEESGMEGFEDGMFLEEGEADVAVAGNSGGGGGTVTYSGDAVAVRIG